MVALSLLTGVPDKIINPATGEEIEGIEFNNPKSKVSISARNIVIYMTRLHNEWRQYDNPPVLYSQTVSQKSEANKVQRVVYGSFVKFS